MTNMDMSNRRSAMIRQGSSTFVTSTATGGARKSYLKSNNDFAKKESADRREMLNKKLSFLDSLGDLSEDDDDIMTSLLNKKTKKTTTVATNTTTDATKNDRLSVSDHGTSSPSKKSKPTVGGGKLRFPRRHKSFGHQAVSASRQQQQQKSTTENNISNTNEEEEQQQQQTEKPVVLATPSTTPPPQTQQPQHHTKAIRRNSSYGVLGSYLNTEDNNESHAGDTWDSCSVTVDNNSGIATASDTKVKKKKKARRRSSLGGLFGKGRDNNKDSTDMERNDSSHDPSHNPYGYEDTSTSHNDDATVNQTHQQESHQPVRRRSSLGFFTGRGKTDKKKQDQNDSAHNDHSHNPNPYGYGYEDMSTSRSDEQADSHQPQQAESHKPVRRRLSIGALGGRGKKSRDKNSNSDDSSVATTATKTSKKAKKADKKKAKKEKKEKKKKEKNDDSSKVSKKGKAQRRFSGMFSGMAGHDTATAATIRNCSGSDSDEYTMTTEPSSNASLSPSTYQGDDHSIQNQHVQSQKTSTDGDYLRKAKERQEQLRREQQKKQDDLGGSRHRRRFSLTGRRTSIGGNGAPAASSSGAALPQPQPSKPQDDSGFYSSDDDDDSDSDSDDDAVSVSQVGANVLSYGMKFLEGLYDEVS